MKVKDLETGIVLESNNELVIGQWLRHPEKYTSPPKVTREVTPKALDPAADQQVAKKKAKIKRK